ncbi:MAG TPA: vitamin K epoxide reductase family protein [Pyrinomonadaceae bacterium]|nr:vitamin K epoxide reductase family protein [Pyrinomonadaceae bacterium]
MSTETLTGVTNSARARVWDALTALVALVGLVDASYLTIEHLSGRNVRCMIVSGCDEVLQSSYATVAGHVPVASLGALAYFAVFSLATLALFGYAGARRLIPAVVAVMFLATVWFVYLQMFVIRAYCVYCLLSAAVTTTLALLTLARYILSPKNSLS